MLPFDNFRCSPACLNLILLAFCVFPARGQEFIGVALSGESAPGSSGSFVSFLNPVINSEGTVAFTASTGDGFDVYETFSKELDGELKGVLVNDGETSEGAHRTISLETINRAGAFPIDGSGRMAGSSDFHGPREFTAFSAVVLASPDSRDLKAKSADLVPGSNNAARFWTFSDTTSRPVVLNDSGQMVFQAVYREATSSTVIGGGIRYSDPQIPSSSIELVSNTGRAPDDLGQFGSVKELVIRDSGEVAFVTDLVLDGDADLEVKQGIAGRVIAQVGESDFENIATEGTVVSDITGNENAEYVLGSVRNWESGFSGLNYNDVGQIAFGAQVYDRLKNGGALPFIDDKFFNGSTVARLYIGDSQENLEAIITLKEPASIFSDDTNRITGLSRPHLSNNGIVAFIADKGPNYGEFRGNGLFRYDTGDGSIERVFQSNDDFGSEGMRFSRIGRSTDNGDRDIAINDSGQLAFLARMIVPGDSLFRMALFVEGPGGGFSVVAREGGTIDGIPDKVISELHFQGGSTATGKPVGLNDNGGMAFGVTFEGEVESHGIFSYTTPPPTEDFGDAPVAPNASYPDIPAGYPTTGEGAASHEVDDSVRLGPAVDPEGDGQPDLEALGEPVDDDGIRFTGRFASFVLEAPVLHPTFIRESLGTVEAQVTVPTPLLAVYLSAWVDFNRDGQWDETAERIISDRSISSRQPGAVTEVDFQVPGNATPGITYARFRLSDKTGVGPGGDGGRGEVEDYMVRILDNPPDIDPDDDGDGKLAFDYGDAPHQAYSSPTIGVPVGYPEAAHLYFDAPDVSFGTVDPGVSKADGLNYYRQYAMDDDVGTDDENGASFDLELEIIPTNGSFGALPVAVPIVDLTETIPFTVLANTPADVPARVNAWIDFNRDGDWADAGEQIVTDFLIPAGTNPAGDFDFQYQVAFGTEINAGYSFARFRISSEASIDPAMLALDGEVEDHLVKLLMPLEYGDAPEEGESFNYPTTIALNGARHVPFEGGPYLGEEIDFELDGSQTNDALGDDEGDEKPVDDEDGIVLFSNFSPGESVSVLAFASQAAKLDAWIDFNRDGDWDDIGEKVFDSVAVVPEENLLTVDVPSEASPGETYARFRISTAGSLNPAGLALDGEVEDYRVLIGPTETEFVEIRRIGDQLYLRWTGLADLEGSPAMTEGTWTVLENSRNEFWHTFEGSAVFFRLVEKE